MKSRTILFLLCVFVLCSLVGCGVENQKDEKVSDLNFTVVESQNVPEEFAQIIEQNKSEPFHLTYEDDELYIAIGYGKKDTGGYSIEVSEFYLSENAVCIRTTLLGPKKDENVDKADSYPYIVVKTERRNEKVLFKN